MKYMDLSNQTDVKLVIATIIIINTDTNFFVVAVIET